jgi:HlyD family secretion protein
MKKRHRNLFIASSVSIAIALSGCSAEEAAGTENQAEKETPVQVESIVKGNLTVKNEIIAKAVSDSSVAILPKMVGELITVNVEKGDIVKKGDILAVIDNTNQKLAVQMEETSARSAQSQYEQALVSKDQAEIAINNAKLGVKQAQLSVQKAQDGQTTGLDNSEFGLEQAQLGLNDAQINYDRMKALFDQGAVSKQNLEQAKSTLDQAQIALNQAKLQKNNAVKKTDIDIAKQSVEQANIALLNAQQQLKLANVSVKQAQVGIDSNKLRIQQAELQLDDSKIIATANGEVTDINNVVGDVVTTGSPFTTIVDVSKINIEAKISATQLTAFKKGQEINIDIPALNETLTAKVAYISNIADEAGFYLLEAAIQNKDGKIKPGMIAKVINESEVVKESLLVPTNAVIEKGDETYIFVVKDGKAVKTPVKVIRAQSELTAIEGKGLSEKLQVVTRGQITLSDDNKVKIIKEEK